MNNYGYHRVPKKMIGSSLFPLNQFKESQVDLYQKQSAKYKGRESLMTLELKCVNCLWNDVIFISPIHPADIFLEIRKAGFEINEKQNWFKIPLHRLEQTNLAVFFSKKNHDDTDRIPFSSVKMSDISFLPQETKDYYKESVDEGRVPFILANAPHLLYKGEIDISNFEIIEV